MLDSSILRQLELSGQEVGVLGVLQDVQDCGLMAVCIGDSDESGGEEEAAGKSAEERMEFEEMRRRVEGVLKGFVGEI
jgi:hypothetical protein